MKRIGIYNASMKARGGGEKKAAVMADHLSRRFDVSLLVSEPIDVPAVEQYFGVDLSRTQVVVVGQAPISQYGKSKSLQGYAHQAKALSARVVNYRHIKSLPMDLFINSAISSKMICPAKHGIFMCMFPHQPEVTLVPTSGIKPLLGNAKRATASRLLGRNTEAYNSYSVVTANSQYTAKWIKEWWGREADVVYSVCDPIGPSSTTKEKIILHVGRFAPDDPGTNYKNQAVLLDAFKRMTSIHDQGWQLHFAGSLPDDDPRGAELLRSLRESASNYPVVFHVNAKRSDLRNLHRSASLYWHATGYGYSEETCPERQEHFGMTTVEAMSAGTVPIVINSGGQRETVKNGETGFVWNTPDELIALTEKTISDPGLWDRLSKKALASCEQYSRAAFNTRMDRIVDSLF